MICSICGGRVEWQGPLSELTHTKCLSCGAINCQEVDPPQEEEEEEEDKMDEIRLICAKCGACAGHPEDREGGECKQCGERETVAQERDANGAWITPNASGEGQP